MTHHRRYLETAKAPTKAPIQYLREALAYWQQFSDADIKCSKTYENISKIKRELNSREAKEWEAIHQADADAIARIQFSSAGATRKR